MYQAAIIKKHLGKLGIESESVTVYLELVKRGYSSALQLAKASKISRTQVYRHLEALKKALVALEDVEKGLDELLPGDLLAHHVRDALRHISSITGDIDVDKDILGTIFGKFCIGK